MQKPYSPTTHGSSEWMTQRDKHFSCLMWVCMTSTVDFSRIDDSEAVAWVSDVLETPVGKLTRGTDGSWPSVCHAVLCAFIAWEQSTPEGNDGLDDAARREN
jgi:hypothetical protein